MATYLSQSEIETLAGYKQNAITSTSEPVNTTDITNFNKLVDETINAYLGITTSLTTGVRYYAARKIASRMLVQFVILRRKLQMQNPADVSLSEIESVLAITNEEDRLINTQAGTRLPA